MSLSHALNHGSRIFIWVAAMACNMAESHNRLAAFKRQLDEGLAGVMPDYWPGHGRLTIAERDFNDEERTFARRLFNRLHDKHPDVAAERLATKACKKTEEVFD